MMTKLSRFENYSSLINLPSAKQNEDGLFPACYTGASCGKRIRVNLKDKTFFR